MVTRLDYNKEAVDACFSVMLEVMNVLGEFRNHIVVIGGWVPYFLIGDKKAEHTGSLDIDLALDFQKISSATYATILQRLKERAYEQGVQPFIFYRNIKTTSGREIKVQVDLLSGEYGGTGRSHRTQRVQDVLARKARGADLVFEDYVKVKIKGQLPDGSEDEVTIRIANVVPFLVMKGMALWETYKEKHAYDIYFILKNYPGGIQAMTKLFKSYSKNKLVKEGLSKIRKRFEKINSPGPVWVTNFEEIDNADERDLLQRDAFERVNALLHGLKISAFEE